MNDLASLPQEIILRDLTAKLPQIEELLPDCQKGKAGWFVKRALLTLANGSEDLRNCTPQSYMMAVVRGAEIGLPIDGRLGYAVPYGDQAQFQPSYIGLCTVAQRSGQITRVKGRVVHQHDYFEHGEFNGEPKLEHSWEPGKPRGDLIGAYARVSFPDGRWDYEFMEIDEIEGIHQRSRAKNKGPWQSDFSQMAVKTVIRRLLKTYCVDAGFILAAQIDEYEYDDQPTRQRVKRAGTASDLIGAQRATPASAARISTASKQVEGAIDDVIEAWEQFNSQLLHAKNMQECIAAGSQLQETIGAGESDAIWSQVMKRQDQLRSEENKHRAKKESPVA